MIYGAARRSSRWRAGRRGAGRRRPRHAGRAGGRIVLHLARRASRDRAGARDAPRRGVRFAVARGGSLVLGALVLAVVVVQAWFRARAVVERYNPGTTRVHGPRLEALRAKNPKAEAAAPLGRLRPHLRPPQARGDRRRGREVHRPRGLRLGGDPAALEKNEQRGKIVAGASTISQQLAKNLFLSGERSYGCARARRR